MDPEEVDDVWLHHWAELFHAEMMTLGELMVLKRNSETVNVSRMADLELKDTLVLIRELKRYKAVCGKVAAALMMGDEPVALPSWARLEHSEKMWESGDGNEGRPHAGDL